MTFNGATSFQRVIHVPASNWAELSRRVKNMGAPTSVERCGLLQPTLERFEEVSHFKHIGPGPLSWNVHLHVLHHDSTITRSTVDAGSR